MSAPKSRWADEDPEEEAAIALRKREKEEKKRAKAERQKLVEQQQQQQQQSAAAEQVDSTEKSTERPTKRRRLSNEPVSTAETEGEKVEVQRKLLQFPAPAWAPCRHVDNYERLNHIEEGSYGLVSRAKDLVTGEVVALKKLKLDNSPDGFPVTGLREIQTLQRARHGNIVRLREIVMGTSMNE
jgi:cell division cycle 2-like protein